MPEFTTEQARAVAQRLRKNGEGCTCMAYGPTECACGAEWGHDYTDQGAVIIDALVAEVERLTNQTKAIGAAISNAGLTLVKTQHGYQMLKLGKIEAQTEEQEGTK